MGISKQMLDEMIDSQKLEKSDDSNRKSNLELLVKAKLDEMKAPTDLIEGKLKRTGELRVKLVMMREDLEGARFAQTVHPGDRGHAGADAGRNDRFTESSRRATIRIAKSTSSCS